MTVSIRATKVRDRHTVEPDPEPDPATITHGSQIRADTSIVGLTVATTRTVGGYSFDSVSAVTSFGANLTGTGTAIDPYTIDRVLFTGSARIGGTGLSAKHFKFTNCRAYGNPSTSTIGGSYCIGTDFSNPPASLTIEDSECGPNTTLAGSGGPASGGGNDKAVQAQCPLIVRRCNLWGAAIAWYVETSRTSAQSILEDSWLHDCWSSGDDHTDMVNGNAHASNVVVRRNFIDGIRTGGAYVVNGFGIYDDPATSAGIIENWTIEDNYVDRCQTLILSNDSTSRFISPFVVTGNVFARFSVQRFACRTPSTQSGNTDASGNPLTI